MNESPVTLDQILSQISVHLRAGEEDQVVSLGFLGLNRFGDHIDLLEPLAAIFYRKGDLDRTCNYLERLCNLEPDQAERWLQLGTVLGAADRSRDAVQALTRAWDMNRELVAAGVNLGITLVKLQWNQQAIAVLTEVGELYSDELTAQLWRGHALTAEQDLQGAVEAYEKALSDPELAMRALMPLALAYRGLGDIEKSNRYFEGLLQHEPHQPMARFALAQNQLLTGDFSAGFANYEYRWLRPGMGRPELSSPLWQEEDLMGKRLLVHDEQGFGDCIQFSRFLKYLQGTGAHILFRPRPKLERLMAGLVDCAAELVGEESADEDFHIPLMSLPYQLGLLRQDLAGEAYLRSEKELQDRWADRLADISPPQVKKVGLVWQGDPSSQSEQGRSVPFHEIRKIFACEDVHFFLLQMTHGREDLGELDLPDHVHDLGTEIDLEGDAFIDTAAIMGQLDLVISSDTATAHLAGALGVPGWVLLKNVPEWRWGLCGSKSVWYGSLDLIRQPTTGDWGGVINQVMEGLVSLSGRP